jgi:hypothetical protein
MVWSNPGKPDCLENSSHTNRKSSTTLGVLKMSDQKSAVCEDLLAWDTVGPVHAACV